jgi:hypothetical protein
MARKLLLPDNDQTGHVVHLTYDADCRQWKDLVSAAERTPIPRSDERHNSMFGEQDFNYVVYATI